MGVAFRTGHLLEHLLAHGRMEGAVLNAFQVFYVLFSCWFTTLNFYSRFDVADSVHKILDAVEFVGLGFAIIYTEKTEAFLFFAAVQYSVTAFRYGEIAFSSRVQSQMNVHLPNLGSG